MGSVLLGRCGRLRGPARHHHGRSVHRAESRGERHDLHRHRADRWDHVLLPGESVGRRQPERGFQRSVGGSGQRCRRPGATEWTDRCGRARRQRRGGGHRLDRQHRTESCGIQPVPRHEQRRAVLDAGQCRADYRHDVHRHGAGQRRDRVLRSDRGQHVCERECAVGAGFGRAARQRGPRSADRGRCGGHAGRSRHGAHDLVDRVGLRRRHGVQRVPRHGQRGAVHADQRVVDLSHDVRRPRADPRHVLLLRGPGVRRDERGW